MRKSIASLIIAVFAGVALATGGCKQQPNSSPNPSGNPVKTPGENVVVPAGAAFDITWQPTTSGTVSIVLLRGPKDKAEPFECIVDSTPNTGTYSWTPSDSLRNDNSNYGIKIITDGTGDYQYSFQFGISNPHTEEVDSANQHSTSTTAKHEQNTVEIYPTTSRSVSGTAPASSKPSDTRSTFNHATAPVYPVLNSTAKPTFSYNSHLSLSTFSSAHQNISTKAHEVTPTKPITKPASLEPVQTSVAIEEAPLAEAPTTTETPSVPNPASAPAGAAGRVVSGGLVAGLGAVAAFVL